MYNDKTPIYEIIMLTAPITIDDKGFPNYGRAESVGFYYEQDIALKAVRQNWCNVNDGGVYKAALVQKKVPGLYPIPQCQWYFVFDYDNLIYQEKQLPKELKHFII